MINGITNAPARETRRALGKSLEHPRSAKKPVTRHIALLRCPRPREHLSRAYFIITTARMSTNFGSAPGAAARNVEKKKKAKKKGRSRGGPSFGIFVRECRRDDVYSRL